jgi:hypothetical protein
MKDFHVVTYADGPRPKSSIAGTAGDDKNLSRGDVERRIGESDEAVTDAALRSAVFPTEQSLKSLQSGDD